MVPRRGKGVAYPYAATVQSCRILICKDCTESLAVHICSLPLFLVSAAFSITVLVSAAIHFIVLFVATLRFWPVLETRDDLANDNGQNRPLPGAWGDAGRPLVR